jgi:hypothetical protein
MRTRAIVEQINRLELQTSALLRIANILRQISEMLRRLTTKKKKGSKLAVLQRYNSEMVPPFLKKDL